jgi:hypothetical protein
VDITGTRDHPPKKATSFSSINGPRNLPFGRGERKWMERAAESGKII